MPPRKKVLRQPPTCDVCGKRHWRSATVDSMAHWGLVVNHSKDLLEVLDEQSI